MPVTKCEPETTRKASRKYAKTQETVLSALLAQTEEVSVPLASLIKSPLNVRTVPYSAESVSELADSIKGVGLLQNLVVHALPGDRYGVAAGGRRLAALNMLAERNILPADWPVRVKVIPQELATAASMTENGQRRDMHPAEQIAGFRAMAQEGKTPAQIGDLLGYSPRHVQRMLKLADLAPVILDALAEDRITTEHCQALALENDTARQVQVFEAACQSGWGGKPEVQTIRRLVTESEVAVAGNSKFRFVGADAFSPDELRTDLFSDDEGGYVDCVALDAALLEKLQTVAEHLREAEGWEWCAGRMEPVGECREDSRAYRNLPEPEAVLTEAEEERLNELMMRYDALENQCEESDLLAAEMKLIDCMAKVRAWTPEMRAGSGVVVSWCYGNVCVQRGVQLRSEDDVADDADRTEQVQEKASVEEISLPLLTKMSSERTLAVQAALMQQPDKSLALLAWTLCLNVFGSGAYSNPAKIRLECEHYALTSDAPSGKEGAAFMAMMAEKARLPGDAAEQLFPSVRFRVRERSRHKSALVMQKYSRQQAREAEQKTRAYQALVAQAEIELAFHSPETVGSWHARWSDRVAEHDLETLFWQWGERFPSLAGMERWQWQDMPFWQVITEAGMAAREASHAVREMERWMVPNKLREAA